MYVFARRLSQRFGFFPYLIAFGSALYTLLTRQKFNRKIQQLQQTITDHETNARLAANDQSVADEVQARLSAIVEHSDDAIVSKKLDGTIVSWNKGAERIFGYTEAEAVGKNIRILFPPERLHEEDEFISKLSKGERIDHFETVRVRKDGKQIDISVTLSPIKSTSGSVIGVSKVARDVTERKTNEQIRERLSAIVEYSDDAIVSKTLDGTIVSWNKGAERIFGYKEAEAVGKNIRILFPPERLHEEDEFIWRISRGEHIDHFETVRVRKDGKHIDISVTLSPIKNASGKIIGVSKVAQNITERKQDERRIDLLLELSTAFSRALTPRQIAEVLVERGLRTLGAMTGTVCLLVEHGTMLEILNRSSLLQGEVAERGQIPLDFSGPLNDAVRTGSMVWIESNQEYATHYPELIEAIQQSISRSIICMPLKIDEKIIGGFSLSFPVEKPRNSDEAAFFIAVAHLCAQSLERSRLYEAERRERDLAEALRDTVVALNSTRNLSEVFDQILENIDRVVKHDMADIMLIDEGVAQIIRSHRYAEHGLVADEQDMQDFALPVADAYHLKWVTEHRVPTIISDTQADDTWIKVHDPDLIRSTLIVPIVIEGQVVGFLNVNSLIPHFYTSADSDHLQAFADQAAVAIRNAQLYQRALAMAATEERQRIARDLHDSVSQTLFSANIIAELLPRLWVSQPNKALSQAETLHQLTRGAAAEMRVLLIELRPESLVNAQLKDILTQLGYALLGRLEIQLDLILQDTTNHLLPPEVQVAFYRIAQESLNNIVKYSRAQQVKIRLHRTETQAVLTVIDNGQGFDVSQTSSGLGLKSMRERAAKIGASLDIKSRVGRGTRVRLVWQPDGNQMNSAQSVAKSVPVA